MKKLYGPLLISALLVACGDDDTSNGTPDAGLTLGTAAQVQAYLDGKTWKMSGADIPSHPNGFNEDINFGQATQCYVSVTMAIANGTYAVTSQLGPVDGTTGTGQAGTCNHTTVANTVMFTSTTALIENVKNNAECFDITVTYPGFTQEGRGKISADGTKLTLELYFAGQAQNHRCAAGNVGATGVMLSGAAFTGNAQQVYTKQ